MDGYVGWMSHLEMSATTIAVDQLVLVESDAEREQVERAVLTAVAT